LAKEVNFLASTISKSDPSLIFFLSDFVKDEVYILPMPITLNKLKDQILTASAKTEHTYCKMFGTKFNTIYMCAGQHMEHTMKLYRV
jgi:hypothetical protein